MRVGHFVPHYPGVGGITSMVLGLSSGLIQGGHEVVLYGYRAGTPHDEGTTQSRAREMGAGEHVAASPPSIPLLWMRPDDVLRRLMANADDLDVLVVHGMFGRYSPLVARSARRGGIDVLACPHDPYAPEVMVERRLTKRAYLRAMELPYLRSVRGVHLLAPSHERFLRDLRVETPVFTMPNGLPGASFEAPLLSTPSAHEALDLLYLGRWDLHNKGLDLLLAATGSVVRSGVPVRVRIGGRGTTSERASLERAVSTHQVETDVRLEGFLDDRDAAICEADALVLPSRFDGFGQVVLEALALGTPVLVSSRAGAAEHLGEDDGVVVFEPTADGVSRAIRRAAVEVGSMREQVRHARGSLAERFAWDRIATRWVDEVSKLISVPEPKRR